MVIAIIAVLASMLLPALSKARDRARALTCVTNKKQVISAIHFYCDDNDGTWTSNATNNKFKTTDTEPTWGTTLEYSGGYLKWAGKVTRCPSYHHFSSPFGSDNNHRYYTYGVRMAHPYATPDYCHQRHNIDDKHKYQNIFTKKIKNPSTFYFVLDTARAGQANSGIIQQFNTATCDYAYDNGSYCSAYAAHDGKLSIAYWDGRVDGAVTPATFGKDCKTDGYTRVVGYRAPSGALMRAQ